MSKPSRYGQPENYANRYTGTADYGGVHTNSGIFNFAAYKMMTDSRTSTISGATWSTVFYGSLFKLPSNATFADGRAAVLNTAKSLGFTTTQQQAITDAFNAVGIPGA
jgi:bacillolysin